MNKVTNEVVDIFDGITPYIEESKDYYGYSITCMINCFGNYHIRIFKSENKKDLEKYIVGYTWDE